MQAAAGPAEGAKDESAKPTEEVKEDLAGSNEPEVGISLVFPSSMLICTGRRGANRSG